MADAMTTEKPKVRRHKDSGLQYLLGQEKVLFATGAWLPREGFDAAKNTPGAVRKMLEEAPAGNTGFDWPYACSTGILRHKRAIAKPAPGTEQKEAPAKRRFSSVLLIMPVMFIVGAGSAVMSAYHTAAFLFEGGKPFWASALTGIMLILFSGTAFTAARYFFQEKGPLALFGFLFTVTGFAVIAYSIFSTVTVNYNQFQRGDGVKAAVSVAENEALAAQRRLIEENRSAIDEANAGIASLEKETEYWRTVSWKRYDEFSAQLAWARQRREELRAERVRLESETPELAEEAAASRDTVYAFLARLLGLPEDIARFFVYIVPACLYDILAPFALSVVLLLMDRRKTRGAGD
jgi:hypothetical protein